MQVRRIGEEQEKGLGNEGPRVAVSHPLPLPFQPQGPILSAPRQHLTPAGTEP